jgi:Lamin Tail Domain
MTALRERHVYAGTDSNLRVIPKIGGHLIGTQVTGSSVRAPGSTLTITIELRDDDEPTAEYEVIVFGDQAGGNTVADMVTSRDFTGDQASFTISGVPYPDGNRYYFLKIRQTDADGEQDTVWTAPVWFEPSSAAPPSVTLLSLRVDLVREEATITNLGNTTVAMGGWRLISTVGNQVFTFPTTFSLAPSGVVRVTSGPSAVHQPPGILRWTAEFIWRNDGDPGQLKNSSGTVVASAP